MWHDDTSAKEIRKQKEQGVGRKRWTKFEKKGGVSKIGMFS